MKLIQRVSTVGLLLLGTALPAVSQVNPKNMDLAASPRSGASTGPGFTSSSFSNLGPVHPELYQLWKGLPGRYETTDRASHLSLNLRAISPYVLFVEVRTTEGGQEAIVERGWIELRDASWSYRSQKRRFAMAYRPDSLRRDFGCSFYGAPRADGITFESEGSDCSFALGRRISKLQIDLSLTGIAVSESDGETTLLSRVADR